MKPDTEENEDPKPPERSVENKPEHEKHVDRDGGERQPSDVTDHK